MDIDFEAGLGQLILLVIAQRADSSFLTPPFDPHELDDQISFSMLAKTYI